MFTTQRTRSTLSILTGTSAFRQRMERIDWILLGSAGLLIALGVMYIWIAATNRFGEESGTGFAVKQAIFFAIGLGIFLGIQWIDYRTLIKYSPALYLFTVFLLVAVLFTPRVNGARSWFNLGLIKFQPSELMKPVLVLTLAHFLICREGFKSLRGLALPLLLSFIPLILILKEPDLGGTLTLVPVVVAMLWAAGTRKRYMALMLTVGAITLTCMWFTVMKDYQKRRVLAWLDPQKYSMAEGWQLVQGQIAIGSGGFAGTSGEAAENTLKHLPESHNDFIFAVAAQKGGFLASGLILTLLFMLALSGLGIAMKTRDPAGRLVAVGLAVMMFWQAMINTGVALGLMPTTGQALPLVSYGGSSMLSCLFCLALLVQIGSRQEQSLSRDPFA